MLSNELKNSTSSECVTKLQNLVKVTKSVKPESKILVSLATKRTDDKKLNLKVNTINAIIKEIKEDNGDFEICDNSNLSQSSEIKKKFVNTDGI